MCLLVQDIVIRLYLTTFIKTLLIFMLITLNLFIIAVFYYRWQPPLHRVSCTAAPCPEWSHRPCRSTQLA